MVAGCVVYTGGRQDLILNTSNCVSFPNGLEGKKVQFWNGKAGAGCGFKGQVSDSDGSSATIASSYVRGSGFSGNQLSFTEGNGCSKIRIRTY